MMHKLPIHLPLLLFLYSNIGSASQQLPEGDIQRTPLSEDAIKRCGLSILVPTYVFGTPKSGCTSRNGKRPQESVAGCKGIYIDAGCSGSIENAGSAVLSLVYYVSNDESNERRQIDIDVKKQPFQEFVKQGANGLFKIAEEYKGLVVKPEGVYLIDRLPNGEPELQYVLGLGGRQSPKITYTAISGNNWGGWEIEQTFYVTPKTKKERRIYTPYTNEYRCIALLIGNDSISLSMQPYCFLRRKTQNLDVELSHDNFREIVKSLKFSVGNPVRELHLFQK